MGAVPGNMKNDLKIQAGAGEICESLPVEEDLSYPFLSRSRINGVLAVVMQVLFVIFGVKKRAAFA